MGCPCQAKREKNADTSVNRRTVTQPLDPQAPPTGDAVVASASENK